MRVYSLFVLNALVSAYSVNYTGYKVYRTGKLNTTTSDALRNIQSTANYIDFWTEPYPGGSADLMVKGDLSTNLTQFLTKSGIQFHTMVEDVERLIKDVDAECPKKKRRGWKGYDLDWNNFYDHNTVNQFLEVLAETNEFVDVINIGQSYEGRDMNVLAVTKAGPGAPNVWVEAGIHAREWISPAVATFIIRELVEDYFEHPQYLDKLNWYLLPIANPDGYMYSRNTDRMWRKSRSKTSLSSRCKGVDLNRNWGYHWGESGVNFRKCHYSYPGTEAFSEIETQNMKNFLESLTPTPILGQSLHSYGQKWLWPYSYKLNSYPENRKEIEQLANKASDAVYRVHGTRFQAINGAKFATAAGGSYDWYKGVLGTRFAFTTELRDTGKDAFILPSTEIIPSGEEMWAGLVVVLNKLIEVTKKREKSYS